MKRIAHIVLLLAVVAACHGPRLIPRSKMVDIYCDMFMADQLVRDNGTPHREMDSLLLYEPVFEKYGYDTDDYLHSVRYYLRDPERFAKVFEDVSERLTGQAKSLAPIIAHQEWVAQRMGAKRPRIDSILAPFSKDSMYVGLARVVRDSSRYAAWFRLVAAHEDTLGMPVDSLKAQADSLTAAADSLTAPSDAATAAADSLAKDTVKVESPRIPEVDPGEKAAREEEGRLRRQRAGSRRAVREAREKEVAE